MPFLAIEMNFSGGVIAVLHFIRVRHERQTRQDGRRVFMLFRTRRRRTFLVRALAGDFRRRCRCVEEGDARRRGVSDRQGRGHVGVDRRTVLAAVNLARRMSLMYRRR